MVGPPSEELNCFGAMKLRIQRPAAERLALPVRLFIRVGSPRIRQVYCCSGQFKACRLRDGNRSRGIEAEVPM